jgi:hypothetical protein
MVVIDLYDCSPFVPRCPLVTPALALTPLASGDVSQPAQHKTNPRLAGGVRQEVSGQSI